MRSFIPLAMATVAMAVPVYVTDTELSTIVQTDIVYVQGGQTVSESSPSAPARVEQYRAHNTGGQWYRPVPTQAASTSSLATASTKVVSNAETASASPDAASSAEQTTSSVVVAQTSSASSMNSASAYQAASSITSAAAPTSTAGGCDSAKDQALCEETLQYHNIHRQNHTVANYVWNQQLADFAAQRASNCTFQDYLSVMSCDVAWKDD